jgi:hypothetical protein
MVETRIAPRFRVSKAATIEFIGGRPINCVVRNLSVTGAAVELSDPCGIPDSFLLVMPDDGLRLPCRIVRRGGYLIGVAFD